MEKKFVPITFRLSEETYNMLKEMATDSDRSMTWMINHIIKESNAAAQNQVK